MIRSFFGEFFLKSKKGAISIFVLFLAIPLLLAGTKYVLDLGTLYKAWVANMDAEKNRKTSKSAALEAARNWNPGLTIEQQGDGVFKVIHAVYKNDLSIANLAVPGMDTNRWKKVSQKNEMFRPLRVEAVPSLGKKRLALQDMTKYITCYGFSPKSPWNSHYFLWRTVDTASDPTNRISIFDDVNENDLLRGKYNLVHHDIVTNPEIVSGQLVLTTPNLANDHETYLKTLDAKSDSLWLGTDENHYKVPVIPEDYAALGIDKDKIRVITLIDDSMDIGYAVPAQCNVDVVLAVPVSEGAPIREIGQEFREFAKNFYHTRGVSMGLIPYSGKVSISPSNSGYTVSIPKFSESYFITNFQTAQLACGAALYGSVGEKDKDLAGDYSWGDDLSACPIMCRVGAVSNSDAYGKNRVAHGDLLSTEKPNKTELKFQKMNLNPCYGGYADLLSMKCSDNCETYLPNPYYMIEPTADMVKIYEMCNALYPIDDPHNISNFIFIPVTWANNFWKSWTRDVKVKASSSQLSIPSKTTKNRKKALVLVVNKPDWFEPHELTYIGFDNDYSEIPMIDGDAIDFRQNESVSAEVIQGQKGILKYTETSETGTRTGKLSFPKKYLIRLEVEPTGTTAGSVTFGDISSMTDGLAANIPYSVSSRRVFFIEGTQVTGGTDNAYYITFAMTDIRLISAEITNRAYTKIVPNFEVEGDASTGTVFVKTNVKYPMTLTFEPKSSVTIHDDNGVTENLGLHNFSGEITLPFSGSTNFSDLNGNSKTLSDFSTSGGVNFGHNLSVQKLKYTLENAEVKSATLTDQLLRFYGSYYNTSDLINVKSIILNNSGHAANLSNSTAEQYTDPCISTYDTDNYNTDTGWTWTTDATAFAQVNARNFLPMCYGIQKGKFIVNPKSFPDASVLAGDQEVKFYGSDSALSLGNITDTTENGYGVYDFSGEEYVSESADYAKIFTGALQYVSKKSYAQKYTAQRNWKKDYDKEKKYKKSYVSKREYRKDYTRWKKYKRDVTVQKYKRLEKVEEERVVPNGVMGGIALRDGDLAVGYAHCVPTIGAGSTENYHGGYIVENHRFYGCTCSAYCSNDVDPGRNVTYIRANLSDIGCACQFSFAGASEGRWEDAKVDSWIYGRWSGYYKIITEKKYECTKRYAKDSGTLLYDDCDSSYSWTSRGSDLSTDYCYNYYNSCGSETSSDCSGSGWSDTNDTSSSSVSCKKTYDANGNILTNNCQSNVCYGNSPTITYGETTCTKTFDSNGNVIINGCGSYGSLTDPETTDTDTVTCFNNYDSSGSLLSTSTCPENLNGWTELDPQLVDYDCAETFTSDGIQTGSCDQSKPMTPSYTDYRYTINNFFFLNSENKSYLGAIANEYDTNLTDLLKNKGIYSWEQSDNIYWLCFCGDGNLSVTFASKESYLKYYDPSNNLQQEACKEKKTVTVSPSTHNYELQSDGTYKITLILDRVTITDLKFADDNTQFFCKFSSPKAPERSAYIDYSTYPYNPYLATGMSDFYDNSCGWVYDQEKGLVSNKSENGNRTDFYFDIYGDFSSLTYSDSSYEIFHFTKKGSGRTILGRQAIEYKTSGLNRVYTPFSDSLWGDHNFSDYHGTAGTINLLMQTVTLPVNAVLYHGASGSSDHAYQWQSDENGNLNGYNSTTAAMAATLSACAKLKTDYGSNLRVYLIKYKKQTQYINPMTQGATDFDYSYLDNCATETSEPYMYDISSEEELKEALSYIYADIENWAGKTKAKNV